MKQPSLHTVLSPALLHLYDVSNTIVVVIDVLRATSTIATALYNGAKEVIPVDSVERCIQLGRELECITAGERDGHVAPGLQYGNSSFEYPSFWKFTRSESRNTAHPYENLGDSLASNATSAYCVTGTPN